MILTHANGTKYELNDAVNVGSTLGRCFGNRILSNTDKDVVNFCPTSGYVRVKCAGKGLVYGLCQVLPDGKVNEIQFCLSAANSLKEFNKLVKNYQ